MERPGWASFIGIIMLLIGGCGALDSSGEMDIDKYDEIQQKIQIDINESIKNDSSDTTQVSTELDSSDRRVFEILGDTIVRDSNQVIDLAKTVESMMKMSDYRKKWIKTFAYVGMFIALLFIISGILFLSSKKWVIQFALLTLSISMISGIFQFIIYRADSGTSTMISKFSNFEIYGSIFIDIVLLIVIMVMDKTYYNDAYYKEDYYDTDIQ